jgi:hypothetical protein
MSGRLRGLTVGLLLIILAGIVFGESYRATVTREDDDLYRVETTGEYIKTFSCFVYCYYEDAIIDTGKMVIYFLDSDDECTIAEILAEK